jgi:hypothetical protein
MNLRAGCVVSAGLLLATAANAEVLAPHQAARSPYLRQVSDFVEPDAAIPPQLPPPRYARALLPPQEVYAVLRERGFAPLGAPRLRGNIWTIAAISGDGEDGRLFIDATNGRILSFMPVNFDDDEPTVTYGPQAGPPRPAMPPMRPLQRPPASIPNVASRAVPTPQPVMPLPPMPKPVPPAAAARPVAPVPAPAQSIAVESPPPAMAPAPAAAPPPAPVPSTVGQAKPAPQILPTQDMPKVQDLEY